MISINELYNIKKQKEKKHLETFNKISQLINTKIRRIAEAGGFNIYYDVPPIIIGHPLYDIEECIKHLMTIYRKSGFLVQRLPNPNNRVLYISWKVEDVSKKYKTLH